MVTACDIQNKQGPNPPLREGFRASGRVTPLAPANKKPPAPEQDLAEFMADAPPEFDESTEARLTRRFGAEPDVVSWPQP